MDLENVGKQAVNNIITEFLEVAIHNILFVRKLYPSGIFKLMKKYGLPVHVSVFPDLNTYITECLKTIEKLLRSNQLKQINLCFYNKEGQLVETIVFRFSRLNVGQKNLNQPYSFVERINQLLRDLLLKFSSRSLQLRSLPEGSTFEIFICTTEQAMINLNKTDQCQNFPWIEFEEDDRENCKSAKIVPVHNFSLFPVKLELLVEENIC